MNDFDLVEYISNLPILTYQSRQFDDRDNVLLSCSLINQEGDLRFKIKLGFLCLKQIEL